MRATVHLRGLAHAVNAFKRDKSALHAFHCTVRPCRARPFGPQLGVALYRIVLRNIRSCDVSAPRNVSVRERLQDARSLRWRSASRRQPSRWTRWNRSPSLYAYSPNPCRPVHAPGTAVGTRLFGRAHLLRGFRSFRQRPSWLPSQPSCGHDASTAPARASPPAGNASAGSIDSGAYCFGSVGFLSRRR